VPDRSNFSLIKCPYSHQYRSHFAAKRWLDKM